MIITDHHWWQYKPCSASCLFTGCPHSVVFDARSGCQVKLSSFWDKIVRLFKFLISSQCPWGNLPHLWHPKFPIHSTLFSVLLQIDAATIKIVLWFDNEYGFAHRVVDLVKKAYKQDCTDQWDQTRTSTTPSFSYEDYSKLFKRQ